MTAVGLLALDPNDGGGGRLRGWDHMDGWGPMGGGSGWFWLWGLLTLIGIAVLATVLVLVLRRGVAPKQDGRNATGVRSAAESILDERYARGELTTEEYQERLRVLRSGPGAGSST